MRFVVILFTAGALGVWGCARDPLGMANRNRNGNNGNSTNCVDADGDSHAAVDPALCPSGDDHCDSDPANWTQNGCAWCADLDGDTYGVNCDRGPDCAETNPLCWSPGDLCCLDECYDPDGDGYGAGRDCLGPDCDDADSQCWVGRCCLADCEDGDGDGYGVGPDCLGPDCNDDDDDCWAGDCCLDCLDDDGDGYGIGDDCLGPDCNDDDVTCWIDGQVCCIDCEWADNDGDGRGLLFECLGLDCNDSDMYCWTPGDPCCHTGNFSCATALTCGMNCGWPVPDPPCVQTCLESATPTAQILLDALGDCARQSNCGYDEVCIEAACSNELNDCYGDW